MPLADAVRRGLGEERPLDVAPGCLVRLGEDDQALAVLVTAVLFLWDCWVLSPGWESCGLLLARRVGHDLRVARHSGFAPALFGCAREFRTIKTFEDLKGLLAQGDSDSVERIVSELHLSEVQHRVAG